MTSRTTDLIAIGIIVVASLTFGRQVLEWWHAAPPQAGITAESGAARPAWEDSLQPVSLEFGDVPLAMTRQVVAGERDAAIRTLITYCQGAAKATTRPLRGRDDAEERLLARTASLAPVAEEAGIWRVYVVDERFPLVAGVRSYEDLSRDAASGQFRLVCWGMAMPAGEKVWNVYVFHAARSEGPYSSGLPQVPFPPGARRNLSVRDERGGALVGFSGSGAPEQWVKFYDDWFAENGWSASGGWTAGGGAWSARFRSREARDAARVEIQFAEDGDHDISGLLQIVPGSNE